MSSLLKDAVGLLPRAKEESTFVLQVFGRN